MHKHQQCEDCGTQAVSLTPTSFLYPLQTFIHTPPHTREILVLRVSVGPKTAFTISLPLPAWFLAFLNNKILNV